MDWDAFKQKVATAIQQGKTTAKNAHACVREAGGAKNVTYNQLQKCIEEKGRATMAGVRKPRRRTRRYGFGDYTDDSLEQAQMAVIRAKYQNDCKGAQSSFESLKKMAEFVKTNQPNKAKSAERVVKDSASYVSKACKR